MELVTGKAELEHRSCVSRCSHDFPVLRVTGPVVSPFGVQDSLLDLLPSSGAPGCFMGTSLAGREAVTPPGMM